MGEKEEFEYSGLENLEVLKYAVKYNIYLIGLLSLGGKHPLSKKTRILDFGAGIGTYADILTEQGFLVDCLEPDSKQRKALQSKGYKVYKSIDEIKVKYDLIFAFNVFEHIQDDQGAAKSVSKVLAKNGRLVIYVPAFQMLFSKLDEKVEHYRRYRTTDLLNLAHKANLSIERLQYCEPIGFWAALVYKTLGKDGNLTARSVKFYDSWVLPASLFVQPITMRLFGKNALLIAVKDS